MPDDAYVLYDGSGLSRYNYITPSAVTAILERLYRDARPKDAFVATLPVAANERTIASRMWRSRAESNAEIAETGAEMAD